MGSGRRIAEVLDRRIIRGSIRSTSRFTDLRQWVIDLDEFDDEPRGSRPKANWRPSRWPGTKFTRSRYGDDSE